MFILTFSSIEIDTSILVFVRAKNLIVSIADPFRRSRKFACDYCWPILTVLKTCLWLLLTHFDGLENLLVTIADPFWRAQKFAFDYCHPPVYLFPHLKMSKKHKNGRKASNAKDENFTNLFKNYCYQSSVKIFKAEFSISTCQKLCCFCKNKNFTIKFSDT